MRKMLLMVRLVAGGFACSQYPICAVPMAITMIATDSYNYRIKVPYQATTTYQQQQYYGREYIERHFPQ